MSIRLTDKAVRSNLRIGQPLRNIRSWTLEQKITTDEGLNSRDATVHLRWILPKFTAKVNQCISQLRAIQRSFCLRFGDSWILPLSLYHPYMDQMRVRLGEFNTAIDELVASLPDIQADIQTRFANASEHPPAPSEHTIRRCYYVKHNIEAIMSPSDWQRTLNHDARQEMVASFDNMLQEGVAEASRDACERIYLKVQHLADKLADPNAIFRDSAVTNIKEIVELLPHFNLIDDPMLNQLYFQLRDQFAELDPDSLRNQPLFRDAQAVDLRSTAEHIKEVMEAFNAGPRAGTDQAEDQDSA